MKPYSYDWVGHIRPKNVGAATTPIATAIKNNATHSKFELVFVLGVTSETPCGAFFFRVDRFA